MDCEKRDEFVREFRNQVDRLTISIEHHPLPLENLYACAIVPLLHIVFEQGERIERLEDQVIGLLGG
ncbi:MAG: hypothetical protein V3V08_05525 [Nannocystaceae bacterium]